MNNSIFPTIGEGELTKREYFAAEAMKGLLSGADYDSPESCVHIAVEHADALIKELNKEGGKK